MRRTALQQSAAIATALAIALIAGGLICITAAAAMARHCGNNYACHMSESRLVVVSPAQKDRFGEPRLQPALCPDLRAAKSAIREATELSAIHMAYSGVMPCCRTRGRFLS